MTEVETEVGGVRGRVDWRVWVGVAFSVGFLYLALRDVQPGEIVAALQRVEPGWLVLAVGSFGATTLAKAARWRVLFGPHKPPSLGKAFSILSIALFLNAFAPVRLGELARAYLMGESEAKSKVYVLGTVAVEKVTDLVFLMFSLAILLWQMQLPEWLGVPARGTAITILVLLPVGMLLAWQNELVVKGLWRLDALAGRFPVGWLIRQISNGLASVRGVREPRIIGGLIFWSVVVWSLGVSTNYLTFAAMGLGLSVQAALLLLVVLQVGIAVPSSPGRIGVFHYLVVLTLAIFAVDKDVALSYSVVLYLVVFGSMAALGAFCLWREKVTWETLSQAAGAVGRLAGRWGEQ